MGTLYYAHSIKTENSDMLLTIGRSDIFKIIFSNTQLFVVNTYT